MIALEPRAAELPDADALQAVLVTSGNAIPALPASHRGLMLLAVGDATAARAAAAGHARVHSAGADARALAALAGRLCDPGGAPLLLASGEGQGAALAAELAARGFTVVHRAVYAARALADLPDPARDALRRRGLRAALFFSAASAGAFGRLVQQAGLRETLASVDALAIGPPAAAALTDLPWREVRVALRPNQDELLALLQ